MLQNAQTLLLQSIETLIQDNQLEQAIDMLLDLDQKTKAGISTDIIAVSASYRSAVKEYRIHQAISFEEFSRFEARTRTGLLSLMTSLPKKLELNAKIRGLDTYQFDVPDNIRLEKIIGDHSNILKINWLEKALTASRAVCRVVNGGNLGTGFLTRDGYLFTNNHVISDAVAAGNTRIEFNYKMNTVGQIEQRTIYQLDPSDFITSPPDQLDFTRVKIKDNPAEPLAQWGFLEIDPTAIPVKGEPATIIQHPKGQDMQIALNANDVLSTWNQYLFYQADTEPGSSGSPVFNKDWKVVALHHAGKTIAEGGMQINASGERAGANRGILFGEIMAFIRQNGGKVASGTSAGQESVNIPYTPTAHYPTPEAPIYPQSATPTTSIPTTSTPTITTPKATPKIVFLYDLQDEPRATQLNKHLTVLKMTKKIEVYNVQQVQAGVHIQEAAEPQIAAADYIFILISANIFNEEAAWLGKSLEALELGKKVIPIMIDKVDLDGTGLEKLRSLPTMNRVISEFPNPEAAYSDVVAEIKRLIGNK